MTSIRHRWVSVTWLVIVVFATTTIALPFAEAQQLPRGDLNENGVIDLEDRDELIDFLVGRTPGFQKKIPADFNNDGVVDVADVLAILNYDGDWDGDGISDKVDPFPLNPNTDYEDDTDGDGVPDEVDLDGDNDGYIETINDLRTDDGVILNLPGATDTDADGDGWSNVEEEDTGYCFQYPGSIPQLAGANYAIFTDPLLPDTDRDGLTDFEEAQSSSSTDALNPDTDFDGVLDGWDENPLEPSITNLLPGAPGRATLSETIRRTNENFQTNRQRPACGSKSLTAGGSRGRGFQGPAVLGSGFESVQSDKFTGAFSYSVPIKVPPGRVGMEPNLELAYRSTNSNSWVGIGWDLEVGRIARSTRNGRPKYTDPLDPNGAPHDDDPETPLDNPDSFIVFSSVGSMELAFSGQESIEGENCAVYFACVDTGIFVRYIYHPIGQFWEAQSRDGRRLFFGGNPNSNKGESGDLNSVIEHSLGVFSWGLDEEWDLHGDANKITYTYQHTDGASTFFEQQPNGTNSMYVSQIGYNFIDGAPQVKIDFEITHRSTDTSLYSYRDSFRSGMRVQSENFLTSISQTVANRASVYAGHSERVRTYVLGYDDPNRDPDLNPIDGRTISCLASVQEFGEDLGAPGVSEDQSFPAFTFEYSTHSGSWQSAGPRFITPQSPDRFFFLDENNHNPGCRITDLNGDALIDLLRYDNFATSELAQIVALNDGANFVLSAPLFSAPGDFYFVSTDDLDVGSRIGDLNGDSLPDFLRYDNVIPGDFVEVTALNNGTSFKNVQPWTAPNDFYFVGSDRRDVGSRIVDLNGDGFDDLLRYDNFGMGQSVFLQALNNGKGFTTVNQFGAPGDYYFVGQDRNDVGSRIADLNGDGLVDLLRYHSVGPGDFEQVVALNNGTGFASVNQFGAPGNFYFVGQNDQDAGSRIIDLNGDGLLDLLRYDNFAPGQLLQVVALNNGVGFSEVSQFPAPDNFFFVGEGGFAGSRHADLDGDGLHDLMRWENILGFDLQIVRLNNDPTQETKAPNLMTSVNNGKGGKVDVTYAPHTKAWMSLHDPEPSLRDDPDGDGLETNDRIPFVQHVVSKIVRTSLKPKNINPEVLATTGTISESYATLFRYSGGLFANREYLGFRKVKEIDAQTGNFTITEYFQDLRKGLPRSDRSYVGHRDDYRDEADGLLNSSQEVQVAQRASDGADDPKLISETHHRYRVLIHENDPNVSKSFTDTSGKLGYVDFPMGATLITPAVTLTKSYEYGGDYSQPASSLGTDNVLVTATEEFFDGRGNRMQTVNYGSVGLLNPGATLSDLDEPVLGDTFSRDGAGNKADGEISEAFTYDSRRNGTWIDVVTESNTLGFTTDLSTGERITDHLAAKTLKATGLQYDDLHRAILWTQFNDFGQNSVIENTYDDYGNLASKTDARGNLVQYTYDEFSRTFLIRESNELDHVTELVTDPGFAVLLQSSDVNNNDSYAATYDGLGRITGRFDSAGILTTSYQYGFYEDLGGGIYASNRVRAVSHFPHPEGGTYSTWQEEHVDGLARLYQILQTGENGDSDLGRRVIERNDRGQEWRVSSPHYVSQAGSETWSYAFHENDDGSKVGSRTWSKLGAVRPTGNLIEVDIGKDAISTVFYNSVLSAISTDPLGNELRSEKDAFGNLVSVTEPGTDGTVSSANAHITTYGHDALGRIEYVRRSLDASFPAQDPTIKIKYDSSGNRISLEDPDRGTSQYQYDLNNNLVVSTDARGRRVTRTYDALNRILTTTYPDGLGQVEYQFSYDDSTDGGMNTVGRLAQVSDPNCTTTYSYDDEGRNVRTRRTISGATYETTRTFDFAGRPIELNYPTNAADLRLLYDYDNVTGDVEQIADLTNGKIFLAGQMSSVFGTPERVAYGNGINRSYKFDSLGVIKELRTESPAYAQNEISRIELTTDLRGNLIRQQELVDPPEFTGAQILGDMSYQYDHLHRLIAGYGTTMSGEGAGTVTNPRFAYSYDALGRMVSNSRFDNVSPQYQGLTPKYEYSTNPADSGPYHAPELITIGGDIAHSLEYDEAGNLLSVSSGVASSEGNLLDREYSWDALGRLTAVAANGVTTSFIYDAQNRRIRKISTNGTDVTYVGELVEVTPQGVTAHVMHDGTRIARVEPGGNVSYIIDDQIGSSTIMSNELGEVVQRLDYEPYGAIIENSRSMNLASFRHTFTGQELDSETELMFYGARYYDPVIGLFCSADPIVPDPSMPQSFNRYAYVMNSPLMYTDPTGNSLLILAFVVAMIFKPFTDLALAKMNDNISDRDFYIRLGVIVASYAIGGAGASGPAAFLVGAGVSTYSSVATEIALQMLDGKSSSEVSLHLEGIAWGAWSAGAHAAMFGGQEYDNGQSDSITAKEEAALDADIQELFEFEMDDTSAASSNSAEATALSNVKSRAKSAPVPRPVTKETIMASTSQASPATQSYSEVLPPDNSDVITTDQINAVIKIFKWLFKKATGKALPIPESTDIGPEPATRNIDGSPKPYFDPTSWDRGGSRGNFDP